jgi:hypothetical protein
MYCHVEFVFEVPAKLPAKYLPRGICRFVIHEVVPAKMD